jgi:hypothetical protein
VTGDITEEYLGIKDNIQQELCEQVSVVFHCAANVRFDQKLRNAVNYNTLGTKRCLEICRNMKNLVVRFKFYTGILFSLTARFLLLLKGQTTYRTIFSILCLIGGHN